MTQNIEIIFDNAGGTQVQINDCAYVHHFDNATDAAGTYWAALNGADPISENWDGNQPEFAIVGEGLNSNQILVLYGDARDNLNERSINWGRNTQEFFWAVLTLDEIELSEESDYIAVGVGEGE